MYCRLFYYIKLSYKVNSQIVKGTSFDLPLLFFALFLVDFEKFYQAQASNLSHTFDIRTEPEPSYKIAYKWCF